MQHRIEWNVEEFVAQFGHGSVEVFRRNADGVVVVQGGEFAGELASDCGCGEVKTFHGQRDDVTPAIKPGFDLAAQPIAGIAAALERGRSEYYQEVGAGMDVFENDRFEVAAGETGVVHKHVIAVVVQVLENGQRPREVGAAVADEDSLLDARHGR